MSLKLDALSALVQGAGSDRLRLLAGRPALPDAAEPAKDPNSSRASAGDVRPQVQKDTIARLSGGNGAEFIFLFRCCKI